MSLERLQALVDEGVLDAIYNQLKTGKEAEVWLVSHHGEPVAAKLYKEREFRSFKNDAAYREGRTVRNTRTQRAMDKGSKFGREQSEEAWKSAEVDAMFALHAAGVRVPKPVLFYEGTLLMEVIGDAEGRVAPRLVECVIEKDQAEPMYRQLRGEVIKMLSADWIHGDLSEFNILMGVNGPVIIDFPQVITAAKNSRSEQFFRRDLGNLTRFFSAIDPSITQKHGHDADEIWRAYVRRNLHAEFEPRAPRPGGPQGRRDDRTFRGPGGAPRGGPPRDARGEQPRGGVRPEQQLGQPPRGGAPRDDRQRAPQPPRAGQNPRDAQPPRNGQERHAQQPRDGQPPRDGQLPRDRQQPREAQQPRVGQQTRDTQQPRDGRDARPGRNGRQQPHDVQQPHDAQSPLSPAGGAGDRGRGQLPREGQNRRDGRPREGQGGAPARQQQSQRRGPEVVFKKAPTSVDGPPQSQRPSRPTHQPPHPNPRKG